MKIKDVEERTGLSCSNVRFYEKENSLSLQETKVMVIEIIQKMMWKI